MTTKADLITTARARLADEALPYLWEDTELTTYIQDAEKEATERANLLPVDGVSEYCDISIVAGTATYAASPYIYEIKKARIVGQTLPLTRTSREKLNREKTNWEDETGVPVEYYFDVSNNIRLYPNPTEDGTLNIAGLRFPVVPMGTSPEINIKYHIPMLDWVYRQAYLKQDSDAYDIKKSEYFEMLFTRSFGPKKDYRTQTRQLKNTPTIMKDSYEVTWRF